MTLTVAVVQAAPVILDADASVAKACDLIGEAAVSGARLIALPEVFVALYPSSRWAHACARFTDEAAELHRRMWAAAVDVPGPLTDRLGAPRTRLGRDRGQRAQSLTAGDVVELPAVVRPGREPRPLSSQAHADAARAGVLGSGSR